MAATSLRSSTTSTTRSLRRAAPTTTREAWDDTGTQRLENKDVPFFMFGGQKALEQFWLEETDWRAMGAQLREKIEETRRQVPA
jgi:hypothetical protein